MAIRIGSGRILWYNSPTMSPVDRKYLFHKGYSLFLLVLALAIHIILYWDYRSLEEGLFLPAHWSSQFSALLLFSLLCSVAGFFLENSRASLILILLRFLATLLLGYPLGSYYAPEMYLTGLIIIEAIFYLDFREGIFLSLLFSVIILSSQRENQSWDVTVASPGRYSLLLMGLYLFTILIMAALLKQRTLKLEQNRKDLTRLDRALNRLTEVNLDYQSHAVQMESEGINKERRRISREIHDIVGYTMTNQLMIVQAVLSMENRNDARLEEILKESKVQIEKGIAEARTTLRSLHSSHIEREAPIRLIQKLTDTFEQLSSVEVRVDYTYFPDNLDKRQTKALYRIIQEGMTNAFRHGMATRIDIHFWKEKESWLTVIEDNGRGAEKIVEGVGLSGMTERLSEVGGELEAVNLKSGFMIRARMPVNYREVL